MIVRKLRIEKGLSQEQLAFMAGISVRTLQRIERGANASSETLKCLAAVLETDFSNLRDRQDMTTTTSTPLPDLSENEQRAMEYVRDIRGFYVHAIQYAVIMTGLAVINLLTGPDYLWFLWPAFGWGIGLAVHGMSVFEIVNLFGDRWKSDRLRSGSQEPGKEDRDPSRATIESGALQPTDRLLNRSTVTAESCRSPHRMPLSFAGSPTIPRAACERANSRRPGLTGQN